MDYIIIIGVLIAFLILLVIGIVITRMWDKPEVGNIFQNPLYGLYFMGNDRIDESVVEVVDRNNMYHADDTKATIEDANPQYAGASRTINKDTNLPNAGTGADKMMVVDEQGYARIADN